MISGKRWALTWLLLASSCVDGKTGTPATGDAAVANPGPGVGMSVPQVPATVPTSPTWHEHVAPLLNKHCAGCHRDGGIAPFALQNYASVKELAALMADRTAKGIMPPWGATDTDECKPRFSWKHDIRLSEVQKKILKLWADQGAPEGDPAKAAPLPKVLGTDLEDRNARTTMPKPYKVTGRKDTFRCFVMPQEFDKDVWLTGIQVVPGNSKVVHHVLVWLDEEGKSRAKDPDGNGYPCQAHPGVDPSVHLAPWAPGAIPVIMPEGVGMRAKKGSKVVVNIHYHPATEEQQDATSVDLKWTTTATPLEGLTALIGNFDKAEEGLLLGPGDRNGKPEFRIPANAKGHTEIMHWKATQALAYPVKVFGVGTHMHYVGTNMRIDVDRSGRMGGPGTEPTRECLIQTPQWDFNWQRGYAYDTALDKVPTLKAGDVLKFHCEYNNSMDNAHVRTALADQGLKEPHDVNLGEETLDEMCLGAFGIAFPAGFRK